MHLCIPVWGLLSEPVSAALSGLGSAPLSGHVSGCVTGCSCPAVIRAFPTPHKHASHKNRCKNRHLYFLNCCHVFSPVLYKRLVRCINCISKILNHIIHYKKVNISGITLIIFIHLTGKLIIITVSSCDIIQ